MKKKRDYLLKLKILIVNVSFFFNRKKRRKVREFVKKQHIRKICYSEIREIEKNNKEYWIFCPLHPIGDLLVICSYMKSFKEKNGGKILILVKNAELKNLVEMFSSIDKVMIIDEKTYIYYQYESEQKFSNKIQKGKVHFLNADKIASSGLKFDTLRNLYKYSLNLETVVPENPVNTVDDKDAINKIFSDYNFKDSIILISPYANSLNYKVLSKEFWIDLANELVMQGYDVVFNSNTNFEGYKTLFLPLSQIGLFAEKCHSVICFRSGIADLISLYAPEKLIVLYPPQLDHPTLGLNMIEKVYKNKYKFDDTKTDMENMYNIFSVKSIIGIDNINEIICSMPNKELKELIFNLIERVGK